MKEQFQKIPLKAIQISSTNPRSQEDYKTDDLKSLAASITENGLLQPVRVRPMPLKGGYELIIGERRYRAHLLIKAETIDAIVCDYDDAQVIVAQNIENIQRKDVHPMDEAKSLKSLLELLDPKTKAHRYTVDALAVELGKSKSYVWQSIVLLNLIAPYQKLFREGKITKQIAMMLARQTPAQQDTMKHWIDSSLDYQNAIDPDDLHFQLEREFHLELSSAPFDKADDTLVEKAGPCTTCVKSSGNNPDLFSDLGKAAICLDSECFKLKKVATFERNMKALRKFGETFVIVNPDRPGSKNVLGDDEYTKAKKGDKGAVQAIHSDDKRRGAIEWVKPKRIPMNQPDKPAKKKTEVNHDELNRRKAADREKIEAQQKRRLHAILALFIPAIPNKLTDADLDRLFRLAVSNDMNCEPVDEILEYLKKDGSRMNYDKYLPFLRENKISREKILWVMVHLNNGFTEFNGLIRKEFFKVCDELKVKYKPILQKIAEEEKLEEKAAKEQAAAETKRAKEHSKKAGTIGGVGKKKSLVLPDRKDSGREDLEDAEE